MGQRCTACRQTFEWDLEDLKLLEKINASFEVGSFPPSPLCADCRIQRKMLWRNERRLYHRTCDATGKSIISVHPQSTPFPVYERNSWWGDTWDGLQFGRAFDTSQSFFAQIAALQREVPRAALNIQNSENCDYCNYAFDCRNSYLSACVYYSESLLYCYWMLRSKDCLDCSYCFESERCISCTDCNHSYDCYSCTLSHTCTSSSFLYDCRGCTECFGCVGLRQKSFCFFNEQLTKEEYRRRLREFDLENPAHIAEISTRLAALRRSHPHRYSVQEKTEDCTGDYVFESKHCLDCFQTYRSHDCVRMQDTDDAKDSLDSYHIGWSELLYDTYGPVHFRSGAFLIQCWTGSDLFYCDNCKSCSHCFGCNGLRNKQYCILNKQYSKEEYLRLLPSIRTHMEKTGEWGVFFPPSLTPFGYDEATAQIYFPLSKDRVEKQGWKWSGSAEVTRGKETMEWSAVPQNIVDTPETITREVFCCKACQKNFKIIPQELTMLRERQLPLPRQCPDCRHEQRLKTRNPRKLWPRTCAACKKDLQTTFTPEQEEIVVCDECYLKEVY